ncbi:MAG: outer membrane protein assembly factor BamA [Desulfobacteraceae bacterium]
MPAKSAAILVLFILLGLWGPGVSYGAELAPIAVLPFRVHSPQPMEHLREDLQQTLTGHLAEAGFKTIPPKEINSHPMAFQPMFKAEDMRVIGKDVGARWVISGSLTQVGVRVSLDLRGVDVTGRKPPFSVFVEEEDVDDLPRAAERAAESVYDELAEVPRIERIEVQGNKRIEKAAILAVLESREGERLDQERLDQDLRAVYQMGFFTEVNIKVEDGERGKVVIFEVQEKPSIVEIEFRGNKEMDDDDLEAEIGIKLYSILNRAEVAKSVNRLKEFYREKGYYNAEIKEEIKELSENQVSLIYEIDEGGKVYITEIEFKGNEEFSDGKLRGLMETSKKGLFSWITKSGLLDMKKLELDLHRIEAFYDNEGYIKARVGDPEVTYIEGEGLKVTIEVVEGPRYKVGEVEIDGDLIKEKEALIQGLEIVKEEQFNREVVRRDVQTLRQLYANEGFAYAEADPEVIEDDETRTVDITYTMRKGSKVRFERINISGNETTRDKVIRRELKAVEGDYYSHEAMEKSTENLHRLGYFEDVEVQTHEGSSEDRMDVDIKVKERPTGSFGIGAGYSSYDKVLGMVQLSEQNLFGYGQQLSIAAKVGSRTQDFDIKFTEPWFLDRPISAGVDLYKWEKEYYDYTKDSLGGAVRFRFPIGIDEEHTKGAVRYAYEDAKITDVSDNAAYVIRDMKGSNVTSSITLGIARDSRDRLFHTNKGSVNDISYEYAGGFLGGDCSFHKIIANSAWYFPWRWETVLMLRGRWGYITRHGTGKLPVYEKFFLGGIDSVRGFDYATISPRDPETGDRIGGEKMMAYTAEYRFPVLMEQGIMGVVFFDAGNVFTKDENYTFSGIRKSAGVGIRWYSPLGPLRIEYGWNLDPKRDESSGAWEFTVGGRF